MAQCVAAWEVQLSGTGDLDEDFILDGIRQGFRLTTQGSNFEQVEMENYNSTICPQGAPLVNKQILTEVINRRYVITDTKPCIISALGAIPKDENKIRLIHDCSRPLGNALNDYAEIDRVHFQSVSEAASKVKQGWYMAKIDLESAYRSVPIHLDDFQAAGLKWTFQGDSAPSYMYDTRLPFGAKRAPGIFHRITQAVRRMMARKGYNDSVVYLDDWWIIAETKERCTEIMNLLLKLLRDLSFAISYNKVVPPTTKLTFLGIQLDSVHMLLTLPGNKVIELLDLLRTFTRKHHASLKQLQSLAGKLNWAAQVIRGGRHFLRRILDAMGKLQQPRHKIKLEGGVLRGRGLVADAL